MPFFNPALTLINLTFISVFQTPLSIFKNYFLKYRQDIRTYHSIKHQRSLTPLCQLSLRKKRTHNFQMLTKIYFSSLLPSLSLSFFPSLFFSPFFPSPPFFFNFQIIQGYIGRIEPSPTIWLDLASVIPVRQRLSWDTSVVAVLGPQPQREVKAFLWKLASRFSFTTAQTNIESYIY